METVETARQDGFFEGMEWTIDNLLFWVFLLGLTMGIASSAVFCGVWILITGG